MTEYGISLKPYWDPA